MNNSSLRTSALEYPNKYQSLFYIVLNGAVFSVNLSWDSAHDFKSQYPQARIKFQGFVGSVGGGV